MVIYLCITDKGGRNPTCPDMGYHLPQQHLIRSQTPLTNEHINNLVNKIAETRTGVTFVGSWAEEDDGIMNNTIVEYEDIMQSSKVLHSESSHTPREAQHD